MFKPSTLKIIAYVALVCSAIGLILSILLWQTLGGVVFYLKILIWACLLYSSYLGIKLSAHELYEEDFKKLGYYLYGILVLFVLFMFTSLSIGIIPAFLIALGLHQQKKGFDDWKKEQQLHDEIATGINQDSQAHP